MPVRVILPSTWSRSVTTGARLWTATGSWARPSAWRSACGGLPGLSTSRSPKTSSVSTALPVPNAPRQKQLMPLPVAMHRSSRFTGRRLHAVPQCSTWTPGRRPRASSPADAVCSPGQAGKLSIDQGRDEVVRAVRGSPGGICRLKPAKIADPPHMITIPRLIDQLDDGHASRKTARQVERLAHRDRGLGAAANIVHSGDARRGDSEGKRVSEIVDVEIVPHLPA